MSMMKALLAATALAVVPMAASAITLSPNESDAIGGSIRPGQTVQYSFEPTAPLNVLFTFTASGAAADVAKLSFGPSYASNTKFDTVWSSDPRQGFGGFNFDIAYVDNAFTFTIVSEGTTRPVGYELSWITESPAPVPLPAAGLLLGAALLGMGGVAAKRRRKAAEV